MEIITGGIEEQVLLSPLDEHEKQELIAVFRGEKTPSITSDVIAKHVLSPDVYPERLDYILQRVMSDKEMADPNNVKVRQSVINNKMLKDICDEALEFSRDKEVQAMLLAEKMAVADWNSNRTAGREELNALYVWLHEQKRDDDLFKALNDATFRQTLFDEYDRHHVSKP